MRFRIAHVMMATVSAAALLATLLLLPTPKAGAQSQESGEGLVGTWHVTTTKVDCAAGTPIAPSFMSLVQFTRGGTTVADTNSPAFLPGQRTAEYGVWQSTGPRTYRSVREAYILFTGGPFERGYQRIAENIELEGNKTKHVNTAQFFDESGNLVSSGCSTSVGERFE
jgi:hypothetical protein